jgi:ADP-heptose:LPS heptosyltransferase
VNIRWRLGDEIMAIPIYQSIKSMWPDCELYVACSFPELIEDNPHVDGVISDEVSEVPDCDRYIYLRDASRTVPRREHYARLAGVPVSQTPPTLHWPKMNPPFEMNGQWIAVSTGATWRTKRWPLSAWTALCNTLHDHDYQLIQIGQGDDRIGLDHDYVDRTSIREAGAILSHCSLFIGCDSGLLHLAAAVRTPAIGLFGPTDPGILFGTKKPITALRIDRPCATCWNGPLTMREPGVCPLNIENCLETISPEAVSTAALAALNVITPADRCA